jgi:hypothetical protein
MIDKDELKNELQGVLNYIGSAIDKGFPMTGEHLNELWQWVSDILGELE